MDVFAERATAFLGSAGVRSLLHFDLVTTLAASSALRKRSPTALEFVPNTSQYRYQR